MAASIPLATAGNPGDCLSTSAGFGPEEPEERSPGTTVEREQPELRPIATDCTQLGEPVACRNANGHEDHRRADSVPEPSRGRRQLLRRAVPVCVRLLGIEAEAFARKRPLDENARQPRMIRVGERRPGEQDGIRSLDSGTDGIKNLLVVGVTLVVDAAKGEPDRAGTENRAGSPVFLPPSSGGIALRLEARPAVPPTRRRERFGIPTEHSEKHEVGA